MRIGDASLNQRRLGGDHDRRWNTDERHQANGYEHQWRVMRPGSRRAIRLAEASADGKRCEVADQTLTVMQRFTRRWSAMTSKACSRRWPRTRCSRTPVPRRRTLVGVAHRLTEQRDCWVSRQRIRPTLEAVSPLLRGRAARSVADALF